MTHDSQDNKCALSNTQRWVTLGLDVQQNGETSTEKLRFLRIHGSMHHDSILITPDKMQQYAGVYLL